MKLKGKRVILTKQEIRDVMKQNKETREFFEKNHYEEKSLMEKMILLMQLMKNQGYDFTKTGKDFLPKKLRNQPKHRYFYVDEHGRIIYL